MTFCATALLHASPSNRADLLPVTHILSSQPEKKNTPDDCVVRNRNVDQLRGNKGDLYTPAKHKGCMLHLLAQVIAAF